MVALYNYLYTVIQLVVGDFIHEETQHWITFNEGQNNVLTYTVNSTSGRPADRPGWLIYYSMLVGIIIHAHCTTLKCYHYLHAMRACKFNKNNSTFPNYHKYIHGASRYIAIASYVAHTHTSYYAEVLCGEGGGGDGRGRLCMYTIVQTKYKINVVHTCIRTNKCYPTMQQN